MAHPSNIAAGSELELAEALFKLLLQISRHNRDRISTLLEVCNNFKSSVNLNPQIRGWALQFDLTDLEMLM